MAESVWPPTVESGRNRAGYVADAYGEAGARCGCPQWNGYRREGIGAGRYEQLYEKWRGWKVAPRGSRHLRAFHCVWGGFPLLTKMCKRWDGTVNGVS